MPSFPAFCNKAVIAFSSLVGNLFARFPTILEASLLQELSEDKIYFSAKSRYSGSKVNSLERLTSSTASSKREIFFSGKDSQASEIIEKLTSRLIIASTMEFLFSKRFNNLLFSISVIVILNFS